MINQYSEINEQDDLEEVVPEEEKAPIGIFLKLAFAIILTILSIAMIVFGSYSFIRSLTNLRYKEVQVVVGTGYFVDKHHYMLSYEIKDKEYVNDLIIEKDLKNGDKYKVYYDPKDPEKLILKKTIKIHALIIAIVGVYIIIKNFPNIFKYAKESKKYFKEEEIE